MRLLTINCRALLFDMDGTIVDSTSVVERAWGWWAQRHGLALPDVLLFSHGRPTEATLEHFLPGTDHSEELAELLAFEEAEIDGIVAIPGAGEVLRKVELGAWAVVTSAPRQLAISRITAAGLPLPKVLIPVDEVEHGKPHPEGYLRAADELRVEPRDCVVFEDTRPGIEAGLRAGMRVVGLLTTMTAERLEHQPVIKSFRDVDVRALKPGWELTLRESA